MLFITYKRLHTAEIVFQAIREAKPERLYFYSNAPHPHKDETTQVESVRKLIDSVDWPCEIQTLFLEEHLPVQLSVASAIDWLFENEEEGIILEDDCVPDPSFFRFCNEMLDYWRHDSRIGMISGNNLLFGRSYVSSSYFFSRINHIWGWATWRRAWMLYDREATTVPELLSGNWLDGLVGSRAEKKYWSRIFKAVHDKKIDTWDYQWTLTSLTQGMLCVIPKVNLVMNIGFGPGGTNTAGGSIYSKMKCQAINFPLEHPNFVLPSIEADNYVASNEFKDKNIFLRLLNRLINC